MSFPAFKPNTPYRTVTSKMLIIDTFFLGMLIFAVINAVNLQWLFILWYGFAILLGLFLIVVPDRHAEGVPTWHFELCIERESRLGYYLYHYGYEITCACLLIVAQYYWALGLWVMVGAIHSSYKGKIRRIVENRGNAPDNIQNLSRIAGYPQDSDGEGEGA